MRHGQPPRHDLARGDFHQESPLRLVLSPSVGSVRSAKGGRPAYGTVHHAQTVQMAPVLRHQSRHERRLPAGDKAVVPVEPAEAGEAGIDKPQAIRREGELMDIDLARDVAGSGKEAGVVTTWRVEPGTYGRLILVVPDLPFGAECEAVRRHGDPHGAWEGPDMSVDLFAVEPHHDDPAALVRRDQQRGLKLTQHL